MDEPSLKSPDSGGVGQLCNTGIDCLRTNVAEVEGIAKYVDVAQISAI